jgi:hypothetical protein
MINLVTENGQIVSNHENISANLKHCSEDGFSKETHVFSLTNSELS